MELDTNLESLKPQGPIVWELPSSQGTPAGEKVPKRCLVWAERLCGALWRSVELNLVIYKKRAVIICKLWLKLCRQIWCPHNFNQSHCWYWFTRIWRRRGKASCGVNSSLSPIKTEETTVGVSFSSTPVPLTNRLPGVSSRLTTASKRISILMMNSHMCISPSYSISCRSDAVQKLALHND